MSTSRTFLCAWLAVGAALCLGGCRQKVPADRYGVSKIRFSGVSDMNSEALRACLATSERDSFGFTLGALGEPECGTPPFDRGGAKIRLWRWWWTDWPTLDQSVFERDLRRIQRWYSARGYYDAKIKDVTFSPAESEVDDVVHQETTCDRNGKGQGCLVQIGIEIEEGEPVLVNKVTLSGFESFEKRIQDLASSAIALKKEERFDEALYDQSKEDLQHVLRDESYSCAKVEGTVTLNPETKRADIALTAIPGPKSVIGKVTVHGQKDLSSRVILGVAGFRKGAEYHEHALPDAQHAIYALGAFSGVEVIGRPRVKEELGPDGKPVSKCTGVVDIDVEVTPGRRLRYGLGLGIASGTSTAVEGNNDLPQWDPHLIGFIEHRNFLGGLRRLRLEVRPKVVFLAPFPAILSESRGNAPLQLGFGIGAQFQQPSFLEDRNRFTATLNYDLGPDPNLGFRRHNVEADLTPFNRVFWDGKLGVSLGLHANVQRVVGDESNIATDFHVVFLNLQMRLDLRDNSQSPTKGAFFRIQVHQAGTWLPSSWNYFRITPEARGYVPLPLGMVLAARFSLGATFISSSSNTLDPVSKDLGPNTYRLRAGGATSNRGYIAGQLGDDGGGTSTDPTNEFEPNSGGIRRWLATLELRVPFTKNFGIVAFGDVGDLTRTRNWRFTHTRLAVGFGLRYQTPIGPLRLDVGFRVPGAQIIGQEDPKDEFLTFGFPGAIHLTFGEAF